MQRLSDADRGARPAQLRIGQRRAVGADDDVGVAHQLHLLGEGELGEVDEPEAVVREPRFHRHVVLHAAVLRGLACQARAALAGGRAQRRKDGLEALHPCEVDQPARAAPGSPAGDHGFDATDPGDAARQFGVLDPAQRIVKLHGGRHGLGHVFLCVRARAQGDVDKAGDSTSRGR